jgi:hypothetical protein
MGLRLVEDGGQVARVWAKRGALAWYIEIFIAFPLEWRNAILRPPAQR